MVKWLLSISPIPVIETGPSKSSTALRSNYLQDPVLVADAYSRRSPCTLHLHKKPLLSCLSFFFWGGGGVGRWGDKPHDVGCARSDYSQEPTLQLGHAQHNLYLWIPSWRPDNPCHMPHCSQVFLRACQVGSQSGTIPCCWVAESLHPSGEGLLNKRSVIIGESLLISSKHGLSAQWASVIP